MFAAIDHSGEARAVGLELRQTKVVIFDSAQAGTPVMRAAPLATLDLPLKVLVWADGDQTKLTYTAPAALAARYDLSEQLADRLAEIDKLTNAVVAHPASQKARGGAKAAAKVAGRPPLLDGSDADTIAAVAATVPEPDVLVNDTEHNGRSAMSPALGPPRL